MKPVARLGAGILASLLFAVAPSPLFATDYMQINLTSDLPGVAANTDPNLINPWGVSFTATSPFWISDQGTGKSTLYSGAGVPNSLVVSVPSGSGSPGPTGQVANTTTGFVVNGTPAHFIFDTLGGTINAWTSGTTASAVVTTPGAVYTGLALASSGGSNYLYAADVTGSIRVFNSSFAPATLPGNFTDPNLPAGYVPFNIQLIGSNLYVTYGQFGPGGSPLPGGIVDVFTTGGVFSNRFSTGGPLNDPWGLTLAPSTFGSFGGDLLIGNFGDGKINAFNPVTGTFIGTLDGLDGKPIVNDFLWALDFRTGGPGVDPNALYFTAGIDNQQHGLFGEISPSPEPDTLILSAIGVVSFAVTRLRRFLA